MTESDRLIFGPSARRPTNSLLTSIVWLGGLIATLAAMTVGAVLAVFTAVAVAVIALFAAVLVFFAGLAMGARRKAVPRTRRADDVIEARKVDGAWVAYGWERPGR
ncbi:MAG: hypothetical protein Q8R45_04575 [Brevundimonas sp.]|uniref:hypothetical protein n=1 Tax=Brevundimonas sp. TaxID=1871086 RepID=UPI00271DF2F2|nr:hypothetical protein [Brevundimonas sp.]MDO9586487.1 hypothetical protein [Brevundimonas sp.]MDP3656227.1 hypothetical protein [Brevundimonas sp.]MDZ4108390.1 hypothetical protein [Brevundimonas sp.]